MTKSELIDIITARLDAKTDSYVATLPSLRLTQVRIDAETVKPANNPRYAFAPARTAERTMPSKIALTVSCGRTGGEFMDLSGSYSGCSDLVPPSAQIGQRQRILAK